MRRILVSVVSLLFIAGFALAAGNPHANGGGTFFELNNCAKGSPGCVRSTFAFSAVTNAEDGTTTGDVVYNFREGLELITGSVDCLHFTGDNVATIGGVVTGLIGPPTFFHVGDRFSFTVQDNGQGKNATGQDLVSDFFLFTHGCARSNTNAPYLKLQGNIQVSP